MSRRRNEIIITFTAIPEADTNRRLAELYDRLLVGQPYKVGQLSDNECGAVLNETYNPVVWAKTKIYN